MRAAEWGWLDVLLALLQVRAAVEYLYIYIYIYIYMYVCIYIYIYHTYIYTYIYIYKHLTRKQERRAVVDAVDLWGESAVLKAARQGRKSLVEALVKAGAFAAPNMQFLLKKPYLRLIDSCITQLKAQGPSRTRNGRKKKKEKTHVAPSVLCVPMYIDNLTSNLFCNLHLGGELCSNLHLCSNWFGNLH